MPTYTPTVPPNPDLTLATLSKQGKPPKARLSNARQAQQLYYRMFEAAKPRHRKAAIIQGMFDGNAPYDNAKRRARGEAWQSNFSSLEGAARKEAAKVPYYDLFSSPALYADCTTDEDGPNVDAATASRIRSENFDAMLRSWPNFDVQFWTMLDDFIGFNKGFIWWPRPDSWHFMRLPWTKVLFPDGTSVDPETWEVFAITHEWPIHKLWGFIKDEEAAKAAGWNTKAVMDAIRGAVPKDVLNSDNPMELQAALKAGELYMSNESDVVQAASVYTREFDGSWSRMMVPVSVVNKEPSGSKGAMSPIEAQEKQQQTPKLSESDWLFWKQKVADDIYQILCPFIFEVGNGSMNSLDGLGVKLISAMQAKDRMICSMVDNVFLRSTIVLQAQNGASQAKAAAIQMGGGGIALLPPNVTVQAGTIFGDIDGSMAVNNDMDRRLDANTGIYRPQFEKPQGNPESATAANIRFSQATVLTNSAVNRFYRQLDRFYAEVFRRAVMPLPKNSKEPGHVSALEFQRACNEARLSEQQCRDVQPGIISATRAIGNGSPVMRQQTAAALLNIYALAGPRGQQKIKEMYVSAYAGQHGVNAVLPREDTAQVPDRDQWDAAQEEADMLNGSRVVLAPWQNHQTHAVSHINAGITAVEASAKGADPAHNALFLQTLLPHIIGHIQSIGHPVIRQQLAAQFKQLEGDAKGVLQAAEQNSKQQQQQSNLTFDQQLAISTATHDAQMKEVRQKTQLQLKAQKQDFDMQMDMKKAKQDLAIKDATAASQINTSTATTAAAIENDKKKTEAQAEAAKEKAKQKPKGDKE